MNEVIAKGCKCKDGTGPVFKSNDEASGSSAPSITNALTAVAIMTGLVQGLLAFF
jgi:hypothetical protein